MDIASGLASASQAISIAKQIRAAGKAMDEATLKTQIADLMSALADSRIALVQARDDLAARDAKIAELQSSFAEKCTLVTGEGDYHYKTGSSGAPIGYPICPHCEQTAGKIVQIKRNGPYNRGKCPSCDREFQPVEEYLADDGPYKTASERRAALAEEQSRKIEAANRNRSSWI